MGRILAIDLGTKRTGLAVTDPLKIFASPLDTVKTSDLGSFIENYLKKESIDAFVVGYPVQMNNTPSNSVKQIDPLIKKIRKQFPQIPLHLADERFTSKMAMQAMIAGGVRKKSRQDKTLVDKISASIILQSFLDSGKTKNVSGLE